jgi:hypothetical protein
LFAYDKPHYTFRIRLTPACADLNAVAVPQGRNIQIGIDTFKATRLFKIMLRVLLFISALLLFAMSFGCSSTSSASNSEVTANATPGRRANGNSSTNTNTNTIVRPTVNAANLPANSTNARAVITTPIPGIDPANAVRTIKPGEKVPGIPDQATVKKQLSTRVDPNKLPPEFRQALNANTNVKTGPTPNANASPTMMMRKKPTE